VSKQRNHPLRVHSGSDFVPVPARFSSGRHLVYTVIAGDYDWLKRPLWHPPNVDYVAFIPEAEGKELNGWNLIPVPESGLDSKLLNRKMKIMGFDPPGDYDSIVYTDGSIQIVGSLEGILEVFLDSGKALGIFRHLERRTPWEELVAARKQKLISEEEHQFEEARLLPFRTRGIELNLFDAGVILKNPRKEALLEISKKWMDLFVQNPTRDQVSLPVVAREYEQEILCFEHWRRVVKPTFLRYPHNVSKPWKKFLFWLGSASPRQFSMVLNMYFRQRQWLLRNNFRHR